MIGWRKLIAVFVGGLVVCAAVRADMVPVSQLDIVYRQAEQACSQGDLLRTGLSSPFDGFSTAGSSSWPVEFLPEAGADLSQSSEMPSPRTLTDGQSSLSLCLSALIGLGLCSSAHCVRKLHFGFIPEWYHNGGPSHIGHSFAVNPDSVCPVPACCFVQPAHTAENIMSQYRSGAIVSLWRESQFTPDVLASRGPPVTCQVNWFSRSRGAVLLEFGWNDIT